MESKQVGEMEQARTGSEVCWHWVTLQLSSVVVAREQRPEEAAQEELGRCPKAPRWE